MGEWNPEYKFFVVTKDGDVESGWEYKSDAQDHVKERRENGVAGDAIVYRRTMEELGLIGKAPAIKVRARKTGGDGGELPESTERHVSYRIIERDTGELLQGGIDYGDGSVQASLRRLRENFPSAALVMLPYVAINEKTGRVMESFATEGAAEAYAAKHRPKGWRLRIEKH